MQNKEARKEVDGLVKRAFGKLAKAKDKVVEFVNPATPQQLVDRMIEKDPELTEYVKKCREAGNCCCMRCKIPSGLSHVTFRTVRVKGVKGYLCTRCIRELLEKHSK